MAAHDHLFCSGLDFVVTHNTESIKHAIVQRLLSDPTTRVAYCSYSDRAARKRSREIRKLYLRAGGSIDPKASSLADWRTGHADGGVWAAGVGGSWTGEGFDLILVDDPVKGRKQAESALEREGLWDFFKDDLETRLEPGGSIVVVHTRWTVDDLGGRLIAGHATNPYEHVHLPAINAAGEALWPERWPIEQLRRIEKSKGPYTWASLYMGRPYSRGGRVFDTSEALLRQQTYTKSDDPQNKYHRLPSKLRPALGADLAYSKKTHADWSVLFVLGIDDVSGRIYVLDVIRVQEKAPAFTVKLRNAQAKYPSADIRWYYAGAELGIADFITTLDVTLEAIAASADKFIRAQPVAAAWGAGRIFIPDEAEWRDDFLVELGAFSGVEDLSDDQIDAFAAAFDSSEQPSWITAMGRWRERGGGPV